MEDKDVALKKAYAESARLNRKLNKLREAYDKLSDLKIKQTKKYKDKETQIVDDRIHDNLFHNEHRMGMSLYEKLESQIIVKNEGKICFKKKFLKNF